MLVAIADTHAAIWYLYSDPRLGSKASALIEAAAANGDVVGVSAISLAELIYLTEKARIPYGAFSSLLGAMASAEPVLRHLPFDDKVAMKMTEVPREDIPDLPDRIVAATALLHGVPVLSRDNRIRSSQTLTIW